MKIAYLIPKPANTGPILVVLELVKAMSEHGHDCTVYYFDEGDEILFPCKTQRISFFQKINFREFDIVHSHGLRPDCYLFLHKPLRCKARCLTTLHNYIIPDFSYQYNKFIAYTVGNLWMLALRRHDTIVTLSKDALQYYRHRLPARKLTYAYNTRQVALEAPLDVQTRQQILQFKQGAVTLGVNAALTDRKGIDQVIRALKKLPGYKLIIAGDGKSKASLEKLSIDEQVADRVLFLGYRKDAYRLLPYYDVFVLPSRSEGFGLTLMESALYRKRWSVPEFPSLKNSARKTKWFSSSWNRFLPSSKLFSRLPEARSWGRNYTNDTFRRFRRKPSTRDTTRFTNIHRKRIMLSVLLSVYYKENVHHLSQALDSILHQSVPPTEIILVKDGPLTEELETVLARYQQQYPLLHTVSLPVNQGLGKALNEGLKHCRYPLIARMDTDDIAKPDRFEKQLQVFEQHPEVDICSAWIEEFEDTPTRILAVKKLPETHAEIQKYARHRCPINHPVVMYKKEAVLKAGGYEGFPEDYRLWVKMLGKGARFYNLQESLLYFRFSPSMVKRRGGWRYALADMKSQIDFYRMGFLNLPTLVCNLLIRLTVRLTPNRLRSVIYRKMLRK